MCFRDARLSDQDGIVLSAATEDLDHTLDLIDASDHRIQLVFLGKLGKVSPKCAKRGGFRILLPTGFSRHSLAFFLWREVRIKLLEDFVPRAFDIDFETLENAGCDAFAFAQETQEDMLGPNIGM